MRFLLTFIIISAATLPLFCQTQKGNLYVRFENSIKQSHDRLDGDGLSTNSLTGFDLGYFLSKNTLLKIRGNIFDQKANYHHRFEITQERTRNHRRFSQIDLSVCQYFQLYKSKRPLRPFIGINIHSHFNLNKAEGPFVDINTKSRNHNLIFDIGLSKRLSGNLFFEFASRMPAAYYRKSARGMKEFYWKKGKPVTFEGSMVLILGDNLKPTKKKGNLYGKKSKTLDMNIDWDEAFIFSAGFGYFLHNKIQLNFEILPSYILVRNGDKSFLLNPKLSGRYYFLKPNPINFFAEAGYSRNKYFNFRKDGDNYSSEYNPTLYDYGAGFHLFIDTSLAFEFAIHREFQNAFDADIEYKTHTERKVLVFSNSLKYFIK